MRFAITGGLGWSGAYLIVGVIQAVLPLGLPVGIPLPKKVHPIVPDPRAHEPSGRGAPHAPLAHALRVRGAWLPLAARTVGRRRRTDELVDRFRGRTVTVTAGSDTPRQLDGDLIDPGRELVCTCVHGRLLVRVPR